MQLKTIEIKGFKSFGDKVVINFNDGVTGIVGPNGCGKSNIVDAMRWVLGEQKTKALRSDKMENVIFNGTKKRKQSQLAEVSLTFDNTKNILPTEYSNIRITRRLFRTGDSEYQINNVNCRLKDINNLFLDTGIGSDSYAIMELKMIDEILNDKDNSRRALFEEASGVSKYKKRKKETLNKLKGTEADLERVEDILFEIEKNLKTLKAQAKKTQRFYELKKQYQELSLDLAHYSLKDFNEKLEILESKIENQNEQKISIDTKIKETEAQIEKDKLELVHQEKLLATRQKATNDFVGEIRQYESDKRLQNESLRMLKDKEMSIEQQRFSDEEQLENTTKELEILNKNLKKAQGELIDAETKTTDLKTKKAESQKDQQILKQENEKLKKAVSELQSACYTLEKNIAVNKIQLNSLSEELQRSSSDHSTKSKELDEFAEMLIQIEKDIEAKKIELENLKSEEENIQNQKKKNQENLESSREKIANLNRQLDAKQNEFNLTKSLVNSMEGYSESLKFLKKNESWSKNALFLSDIINCKSEYKAIIENYLENYLNYFVVNDFETAQEAIELLDKSKKGRANFFINSFFKDKSFDATIDIKHCVSGLEITNSDKKYEKLIQYLLGNVYIIEDEKPGVEALIKTYRKQNPEIVFLSKDGKFAASAVHLSGGSMGMFEGKKIGRKQNLEQLEKEIKVLEENLLNEKINLEKLKENKNTLENSSNQKQILQNQQALHQIENEYKLIEKQQVQHQNFIQSHSNRKEEIKSQQNNYLGLIESNSKTFEKQKKQLESSEKKLNELEQNFNLANEKLQQDSEIFNQANIYFLQRKNWLESIERDINFKKGQSENLEKRLTQSEENLQKTQAEINGIVNAQSFSDEDLAEMYEQKESMEKAVQEAENEFFQQREGIENLESSIRKERNKKDEIDAQITNVKDEINETKLQQSSLIERLSVEFEIESQKLFHLEPQSDLDAETLRTKVEKIKNRLANFGNINPLAVEAYEEIQERHNFIVQQKEDLLEAKDSLLETIAEIDETAKEKFMEAFDIIKNNFYEVFQNLFNEGDTCNLLLTDPENPLESGINIVAKPKGKRPLTINQLSGGEKTLTATALLFSIYLFKPAPFCIFDEVDAPLDDQNIDKFNRIINKFSSNSQFIIVTHNKRTMSTTDVIYGVTMQEQGVSRVVPVDFRSLK